MDWRIFYFNDDLQSRLADLPAGMQARYAHLTQRMLQFGPNLGMPHTRSMGRGLSELRLNSKEGIARVFFGVLPGRRIVMLHVFRKKSEKTPTKELELARRRLEEVIRNADA